MNEKTQKQSVLVFSTSYFPFIGGAEVAVREIASKLVGKFDFFIITSRFDKKLPKIEKIPEGTVVRLGFGNILDKYWLPVLGTLWAWRVPGILFGLDISQGSLAPVLLKFFQPKRFFILNIQYGYGDRRLASGRLGMMNLAFRLILFYADYVTAISTYLLEVARKYGYKGEADVIPNGVEKIQSADYTKNKQKTEYKTIITISRLVPKNGIDILIKAVAKVKEEILSVKCLILGDGPERKRLEQMAKDLGVSTNVEFLGDIPHGNIFEYLAKSNVFVRPSRSEGLGNSFLEAMAAGLPVIGTSVGGIPDFLKDGKTGLFSRVDDPKDLAEKILNLLKNETLAKSLIENSQLMIKERFLWDGIAIKYENLFNLGHNLKILIATGIFPPDIGGPATYSKILLDELPGMDINARVLSFGSVRNLPKIIRHLVYGFWLMIYGRNVDIIFAQDPVSVGFPVAIVSKILRKKFILKVVGDYAWEQWQQSSKGQGARSQFITPDDFQVQKFDFFTELQRSVQKFVARQAKTIIVPSEYLKKIIGMWGIDQEKIIVIYNAFEAPRFGVFKKNTNEIIIISAGRLVPWKGFKVLIEVFEKLSKQFSDLKLVIIGDGPERKNLELQITNSKLNDKIILLGAVSRQKVLEYLSSANIFVLNTAYEGFSHQILEAMALGVPVVTTNIGGNPEIVKNGENGFLVEFNDTKILMIKITEILESKDLAEKFSQKSKEDASKFTKERMIADIIKVLKKI